MASGQFHVLILSTYHYILSQVLICLNLNCKFPSLSIMSTKMNADDSILFGSIQISVPLGEVSSYFHLELVWVAVGF